MQSNRNSKQKNARKCCHNSLASTCFAYLSAHPSFCSLHHLSYLVARNLESVPGDLEASLLQGTSTFVKGKKYKYTVHPVLVNTYHDSEEKRY